MRHKFPEPHLLDVGAAIDLNIKSLTETLNSIKQKLRDTSCIYSDPGPYELEGNRAVATVVFPHSKVDVVALEKVRGILPGDLFKQLIVKEVNHSVDLEVLAVMPEKLREMLFYSGALIHIEQTPRVTFGKCNNDA